MAELRCDLCGKRVDAEYELRALSASFATKGAKDICQECSDDANEALSEIKDVTRKLTQSAMKRYLRDKKKGGE